MVKLSDTEGNSACFDDKGHLLSLCSRGYAWKFAAAGPGCAVAFKRDGQEMLARPAGLDRPASMPLSDAVNFAFDELRMEDGTDVAGKTTVDWWLSEGLLHGRVSVSDVDQGTQLYALIIPDVAVEWDDATATSLVLPRELGCIVHQAAEELFSGRTSVVAENVQFQCFGWAEGDRGLYLDTRDTQGWVKRWHFHRTGDKAIRLQVHHLAPGDGDGFDLPCEVTLGGFSGHWYDLGQIYREWALTAPWASRGPEARRDSYFGQAACWLWNRGAIDRVCPPARELAERIGEPVALDWYWWHRHGYDTEYPDYFPPREGEQRFKAAVRDLQEHNVFVQVYTNGMAYDLDGQAWDERGPKCAVMQENGELIAPAYNRFTQHRLANACGDSEEWRAMVREVVGQARALGLDGLYLDMISIAGGVRPCYNPAHSHAPGGGCYGVQGFRETLRQIRAEYPDFPLSSESVQEQYLDLLEGGIIVSNSAERFGHYGEYLGCQVEPVPLFNAVYHGRTVCFGNYALIDGVPPFDDLWPDEFRPDPASEKDWVELCPDQFAFELARTVAFGCQPMVCNLTTEHLRDPRLERDVEFLVHVAKCYARHKEHLLWGDMLPPGRIHCEPCDIKFLRRYIFTKLGEETSVHRTFPAVLHSAWRAPNGESALLLVNYTRDAMSIDYEPALGWSAVPGEGSGLRVEGGRLRGNVGARTATVVPLVADDAVEVTGT